MNKSQEMSHTPFVERKSWVDDYEAAKYRRLLLHGQPLDNALADALGLPEIADDPDDEELKSSLVNIFDKRNIHEESGQ